MVRGGLLFSVLFPEDLSFDIKIRPSYFASICPKSTLLMSENEFTSPDRVFRFKIFYELHIKAVSKPQQP